MKKAVIIGVLLIGLSLFVYFTRVLPARTYDPTVRGFGTIEATEVVVSPKLPARIEKITVDEGDRVTAGQALVALDCSDLEAKKAQAEAQVAQAEAALEQAQAGARQAWTQVQPLVEQRDQAEREYERTKRLFEAGSVPLANFEKVEAAYKALKDQVSSAQSAAGVASKAVEVTRTQVKLAQTAVDQVAVTLAECSLNAPLEGVVTARNYEPGEMALPGASLLKVAQLSDLYTWIYVPNEEVGRVSLGQKVKLVADTYPDREFFGNVARINEDAEFTPKSTQTKEDRIRLVYGVKVTVKNPDGLLMPGMPVEATLLESGK